MHSSICHLRSPSLLKSRFILENSVTCFLLNQRESSYCFHTLTTTLIPSQRGYRAISAITSSFYLEIQESRKRLLSKGAIANIQNCNKLLETTNLLLSSLSLLSIESKFNSSTMKLPHFAILSKNVIQVSSFFFCSISTKILFKLTSNLDKRNFSLLWLHL